MSEKKVNLSEVVDYTALVCQQPRPVTDSACQVMIAHICEHLSRGNTVRLQGLGTLSVIDTDGKKAITFSPSKKALSHVTPDDPGWPFSRWTTSKVGAQE